MSLFKIVSFTMVVLTSIWSHISPFAQKINPTTIENVLSETFEASSSASSVPIATPTVQASLKPSPKTTTDSSSKISISVDTPSSTKSEIIIYPGARSVEGNRYETGDSGETVYNWYKETLEKRSFKIRNNVKTRANEKFKAVLQGVASDVSVKITIDQVKSSAVTVIAIE